MQGHFPIAEQIRAQELWGLREQFARFGAINALTILLSSESFAFLDLSDLASLRELISPSAVTIAFYCRRPSEVLLSGWREVVKHGITMTLPEFLARAFGVDQLHLVPYNTIMDQGANLFQHFCATFLDWPDAPEPGIRRRNRSLDIADAELIRMLNVLETIRVAEMRPRLYERFVVNRPILDLVPLTTAMARHVVELPVDEREPPFQRWHRVTLNRFGARLTGAGMMEAMHAVHARLLDLPDPDPLRFTLRHL
jgi:hypothetical protein